MGVTRCVPVTYDGHGDDPVLAREEPDRRVEIQFVENPRSGETLVEGFAVDISKAHERLDWEPEHAVEESEPAQGERRERLRAASTSLRRLSYVDPGERCGRGWSRSECNARWATVSSGTPLS